MKRSLNIIIATVIIATFNHTTALKCFIDMNNDLCDEPKGISMDCRAGSSPGCVITEYNSTSQWWNKCHRTCFGSLDASNEGCFFENDEDGGKTRRCYCGSDFCNENFDTAGWLEKH